MARERAPEPDNTEPPDLATSLETLCYIIVKAREYDAKEGVVEPDPGSNPSDDKGVEILEDYAEDPTLEELSAAIDGLNDDQRVELLALTWLGRGDYTPEDWTTAMVEAGTVHDARETSYLIGLPNLGDLIEEGLAVLGYSCQDFSVNRL